MWRCPNCRKEVDGSFEVCWSCGTSPEGIDDPTFVTADQADRSNDAGPGRVSWTENPSRR
jgi:hypothetical protein